MFIACPGLFAGQAHRFFTGLENSAVSVGAGLPAKRPGQD